MIDEIYDRHYREARSELNAFVAGVFASFGRAILNSFKVLNRIEYQAPWIAPVRRAR